jgi:hypothetical protein
LLPVHVCSDVNVYIPHVPTGIISRQLRIDILPRRVTVALIGAGGECHKYLDHTLTGLVKAGESLWTFDPDEREIHIQLVKAEESVVWESVFAEHNQESGVAVEEDRKRLMLERFQAEHPGFDFRGAEFTGTVPDPKAFLRKG